MFKNLYMAYLNYQSAVEEATEDIKEQLAEKGVATLGYWKITVQEQHDGMIIATAIDITDDTVIKITDTPENLLNVLITAIMEM